MNYTEKDLQELYSNATNLEKDTFGRWRTENEDKPWQAWQGWDKIYTRVHGHAPEATH